MRKFFSFLALAALLMACPQGIWAKVYLVSAGISDYPGTANDLRLPSADAKTIDQVYQKNAELEHVLLLNSQATVAKIDAAMRRIYRKAGANDIVVFFISGHGYKGGFCAYDGYLTYKKVREAMKVTNCRNKMIFADTCFSGGMASSGSGNSSQSSVNAAKKANVMLFMSSRFDETSIESSSMSNGFFTSYLQKGLRGGADKNRDRTITAKELFDYVHKGVSDLSRNKQHPVMWGKFADNMPVMKW